MARSTIAIAAIVLAAVTLASCQTPLTEIVVVVTSDVAESVSSVSIRVRGPDGELLETSAPVDGAALEWPVTLSLTRSRPPHRPLTVEVSGAATIGAESVQLDRTVVTGFVPDERRLLAIHLDAACDEPCMDEIDPSDLPPFTGEIPSRDAGTPRDAEEPGEGGTTCGAQDLGSELGTSHHVSDRDTSRPASCVSGAGHDIVFSWRAPSSGRFVIDTLPGPNVDSVIDVVEGCGGASLTCHDDFDNAAGQLWSRVEVDLAAGDSILIYVYTFWDDVPFELSISASPLPEEQCTGGVDDDRDGATDCADPDCDTDAACSEMICDDGLDNELDGDADCHDTECPCPGGQGCFELQCVLPWSSMAIGRDHLCIIESAPGRVRCTGLNARGQLGDGSTVSALTRFIDVVGLTDATMIAAGPEFTCAARAGGSVHCWGDNASGQLGPMATGPMHTTPIAVPLAGVTGSRSIAAGSGHACIVSTDGDVLCWGANTHGQLGDGTRTSRPESMRVAIGAPMSEVAAGESHTCALGTAGGLVCWGDNAQGQIGDGTTTTRESPTSLTTATGFTQVVAGLRHSCARAATTGRLYCWGDNQMRELGLDTTTGELVPTRVMDEPLLEIAAGAHHSVFRGGDAGPHAGGSGSNDVGQLFDLSGPALPEQFEADSDFVVADRIWAGGDTTCVWERTRGPRCGGRVSLPPR